jgi:hypothetical protein
LSLAPAGSPGWAIDAVLVAFSLLVIGTATKSIGDDWRYHNPKRDNITRDIESSYNKNAGNGLMPGKGYQPPEKCGIICYFLVAVGAGTLACMLFYGEDCVEPASQPGAYKETDLTKTITPECPELTNCNGSSPSFIMDPVGPASTLSAPMTPTVTQTLTLTLTLTVTPLTTTTPPFITPTPRRDDRRVRAI